MTGRREFTLDKICKAPPTLLLRGPVEIQCDTRIHRRPGARIGKHLQPVFHLGRRIDASSVEIANSKALLHTLAHSRFSDHAGPLLEICGESESGWSPALSPQHRWVSTEPQQRLEFPFRAIRVSNSIYGQERRFLCMQWVMSIAERTRPSIVNLHPRVPRNSKNARPDFHTANPQYLIAVLYANSIKVLAIFCRTNVGSFHGFLCIAIWRQSSRTYGSRDSCDL